MRLIDLGHKLTPLALAAIMPLALTACGDDITATSDTETNDDDDSSTSDTNSSVTMTTNPTTPTTTTMTTMTTDPTSSTTDVDTDTDPTDPTTDTDTDPTDPTVADSSSTGPGEDTSSSSSSSSGMPEECGNGVIDGTDECDGDDVGDAACAVFGAVACNDDCTLDMSACTDTMMYCSTPAGTIDATTTPEAPLLDAITIADDFFVTDINVPVDISHTWVSDLLIGVVGPDAATLELLHQQQCGGGLTDIDATYDAEGVEVVCADAPAVSGSVLPVGDFNDFLGAPSMGDWTLLVADTFPTADDGVLNEWCVELTVSTDDPVMCGDDVANYGEACDGEDLNEADCASQGEEFIGGTLACADDCTYDTSACVAAGCNGGVIDGEEVCDGDDLGGETCESQGFSSSGGMLACAKDCGSLDTSGCIPITCGDGIIEGAESCDSDNLNDLDCTDFGGTGGTLACGDDCTFDTSGCEGLQPATCEDSTTDGELADDDPTAARPDGAGGSDTVATCQTAVGAGATAFYDVLDFQTGDGTTVSASTCNMATFDTHVAIYQAPDGSPNPFNPDDPCGNIVGFDDDATGCSGFSSIALSETPLVEGAFQVVVSSFNNGVTGTYTLELTCMEPEPLFWGDDFEDEIDGDPIGPDWSFGLDAGWEGDADQVAVGAFSARSSLPFGASNQTADTSVNLLFEEAGTITFQYRVSSEEDFDFLRFFVDGVEVGSWSGEIDWTEVTFDIDVGEHTLVWQYDKDFSVNLGDDTAWIDEVVSTGTLIIPE